MGALVHHKFSASDRATLDPAASIGACSRSAVRSYGRALYRNRCGSLDLFLGGYVYSAQEREYSLDSGEPRTHRAPDGFRSVECGRDFKNEPAETPRTDVASAWDVARRSCAAFAQDGRTFDS